MKCWIRFPCNIVLDYNDNEGNRGLSLGPCFLKQNLLVSQQEKSSLEWSFKIEVDFYTAMCTYLFKRTMSPRISKEHERKEGNIAFELWYDTRFWSQLAKTQGGKILFQKLDTSRNSYFPMLHNSSLWNNWMRVFILQRKLATKGSIIFKSNIVFN